jgi:hypothetical protein
MAVTRVPDEKLQAYLDAGHSQAAAARHFGVSEPAIHPPPARSRSRIGATNARIAAFDASIDDRTFGDLGERMLANGVTLELVSDRAAEPVYVAVRALETLDWRLLLVIPRAQLLGEARALLGRQLVLGAAGLALLIGAISLVAAGISRCAVGTASRGGRVPWARQAGRELA